MRDGIKSLLRRFVPFLIGMGVLAWLLFYATDPDENLRVAKEIEPSDLSMALALGGLSFVAVAFRLKILVAVLGHRVSLSRMFVYTLVGHFYNSALPGGAVGGDAVKALYLSRVTHSKSEAFAAVFVDRLCGLFTLSLIALVMLVPMLDNPDMLQAGFVIFGFSGTAALVFLGMTSRRIRRALPEGLVAKLPFRTKLGKFDEAMQLFRGHKKGLATAMAISILPQAGWIGMHVAIGQGIGIAEIEWYDYSVLIPVAAMVAALPVSFGGWGVGEAATVYFFKLRAVAESKALVLSLGGRLIQLVWALVGLPLSLFLPERMPDVAELDDPTDDPTKDTDADPVPSE